MKQSFMFCLACLLISNTCFAQYPRGLWPFSLGENYIEIKAPCMPAKKVVFTKAYGDWFIKPGDGSATIYLESKTDDKDAKMDIGWNGTEKQQIIPHYPTANNFRFFVYREETPGNYFNAFTQNEEGDETTITIQQMDASTLSFIIEGHMSLGRNQQKTLSGKIILHKDPDKKITTDRFGDCDPVVYNQIPGAEFRSPSDCEIKFDAYLNEQFLKAVTKPVTNYFISLGYQQHLLGGKPLSRVYWKTETKFYTGIYGIVLEKRDITDLLSNGDMDIVDSLTNDEKSKGNTQPDMSVLLPKAQKIYEEEAENSPGKLKISCEINVGGTYLFGGSFLLLKHPEAAFIVQAGKRIDETAGSGSFSGIAVLPGYTIIGIGRFNPPSIQQYFEKTNKVVLHPVYNKGASHLSIQNILIRIDATHDLSNKILELIDWNRLNEMISK